MSRSGTLILVTESFPFGGVSETAFVMPEIDMLSRVWEHVLILPSIDYGMYDTTLLPDNVEVDRSWVDHPDNRNKIRRLRFVFSRPVMTCVSEKEKIRSATYAASAMAFKCFLERWARKRGLDLKTALFYTFWFGYQTSGIMLCGKWRYVTRAHGYDQCMPYAVTLRSATLKSVARLFAASAAGLEFLASIFPAYRFKMETALLGAVKYYPKVVAMRHRRDDKILTFLGCARLIESKRVDLALSMLAALAVARPDTHVRYIHVGSGELENYIISLINHGLPSNMSVELRGAIPNSDVHRIYATEIIDWSILLSAREGGCAIAAVESLAYGVPVVATAVGGLAEVVDDDCGLLLPSEPTTEEFVRGILPYLESEIRYERLRSGALRRWHEKFDAGALRYDFACNLKTYLS